MDKGISPIRQLAKADFHLVLNCKKIVIRFLIQELQMNRSKRCALETLATAWHFIPWDKVRRLVKSLQQRIAKAIRASRYNKAKALQWMLTHSFAAKLLAVKRIMENSGKNTAGVDKITWKSSSEKLNAAKSLKRNGYKAKPLRRVYIEKKNGKKRPLGIPTMYDRAMQALYHFALEPVSETLADKCSYGFRPERSTHDAIQRCYIHLSRKDSATWILEGDIKGCFDNISHQWLTKNIPMDIIILKQWLKAGFIDKKCLFPSEQGTPQGGIISPILANMVLDGLEATIDKVMNITFRSDGCRKNNIYKIHLIRYADDFIITATCKEILENTVKPVIDAFLCERGLQLSGEKTKITHVEKGLNFLGQHIRKYPSGKLIIRPSKDNFNAVVEKIKHTFVKFRGATPAVLIRNLNPIITGWSNYHRHICAKRHFDKLDMIIWKNTWKWARRRHANLGKIRIFDKYFIKIGIRKWQFFGKFDDGKVILLRHAGRTKIFRHTLINGCANPYDPAWKNYFLVRNKHKSVA